MSAEPKTTIEAAHLERLSKLEGVVEGIANQFDSFIKHQDARDAAQSERDKVLFKKIEESKDLSRPNMVNMAAWAGVVVVVIFGIWTPIANGFSERISNVAVTTSRENQLALATEAEKNTLLQEQVQRVQQWQDEQTKADLDELRTRRLRDDQLKPNAP